jgi:hypothetical protein
VGHLLDALDRPDVDVDKNTVGDVRQTIEDPGDPVPTADGDPGGTDDSEESEGSDDSDDGPPPDSVPGCDRLALFHAGKEGEAAGASQFRAVGEVLLLIIRQSIIISI